jgi:type IX secretion system PorP/SprF family membrane protein
VSPGFKRTVTDFNKLITSQSGDGTFNEFFQPKNLFVTGAGLFFSNKQCFVGISTPNLIALSNEGRGVEYNLIGGYVFKVNEDFSLKPAVLVRGIKNSPTQFDLSVSGYIQKVLGIGLSYRNKESIVAFSELLIKKQFKIGYAYDINISGLRKFNSGSHEIMINYFFGKTTNAPSPRFF